MTRQLMVIATVLLLSACAPSQYRAPVVDNTTGNTTATAPDPVAPPAELAPAANPSGDGVVVNALADEATTGTATQLAPPEDLNTEPLNPAVVALLNQANTEARDGQHGRAAASLERALKIEPHNAWLWHRMAQARLEQGEYQQAQDLAVRSNSLAANDRQLLADNWMLIAEARRQAGDVDGAKAAELRAAQFSAG